MKRSLLFLFSLFTIYTSSAQIFGAVDETYAAGDQSSISSVDCFAECSDGRIVIAGLLSAQFPGGITTNIARIYADGSFDPSFHADLNETAIKLGVQPDGKVLVLTDSSFFRLNEDGSPDNDFVCGAELPLNDFFVQSDGKIVVVERRQTKDVLRRLDSEGLLDPTFKSWQRAIINQLHQMQNGNILIGAYTLDMSEYKLEKFTTNGVLDTGYETPVDRYVESLTTYSDGKVVAVFFDFDTFESKMMRLDTNGLQDVDFVCGITDYPRVFTDSEDRLFVAHSGDFDLVDDEGSVKTSIYSIYLYGYFQLVATTGGRFLLSNGVFVRLNYDSEVDKDFVIAMQEYVLPDHLDTQDQLVAGIFGPQGSFTANVHRFGKDGQLQPDFGPLPCFYANWYFGAADAQGRFIVENFDTVDFRSEYTRYFANGAPDNSFAIPSDISPIRITTTTNGRYIVLAFGDVGYQLIRLEESGAQDLSFTPVEFSQMPYFWPAPDGSVIVDGFLQPGSREYRIGIDGTVDSTFSMDYQGAIRNITWQADGKALVLATDSTEMETLYRFNADYTPDLSFTNYSNDQLSSFVVDHQGRIILLTADSVLALQTDGRIDPQFQQGSFDGRGGSLFIQSDDRIVFVGDFNSYNGEPRNGKVRLLTNSPLTVAEKLNDKQLSLAPNPSNGEVFIRGLKTEKCDVVVYNSSGQLVAKKAVDQSGRVDLSELKSGVYQLRLVSETSSEIHPVVIHN